MVGLTSVFLTFGNSWQVSLQRLKDHLWSSTTNLRINFNMSLVTMQSLLQATHQPSLTTSLWTSFTSKTTKQLPQCPRHFTFPTLLPRRMLVFLPTSPWMLELAQEVEQERCHEPWQNLSLRGSSLARIKCITWLLGQSPSTTTIVLTMPTYLYKMACSILLLSFPR